MSDEIRAIPAEYNGVKFRSRLEARWAVFFDQLGVRWLYEYEGYQLPSGWYLPDFFLPELDVWVEIKPAVPSQSEQQHARELAKLTGRPVYVEFGTFGRRDLSDSAYAFLPNGRMYMGYRWFTCGGCGNTAFTLHGQHRGCTGSGSDGWRRDHVSEAERKAERYRFWPAPEPVLSQLVPWLDGNELCQRKTLVCPQCGCHENLIGRAHVRKTMLAVRCRCRNGCTWELQFAYHAKTAGLQAVVCPQTPLGERLTDPRCEATTESDYAPEVVWDYGQEYGPECYKTRVE